MAANGKIPTPQQLGLPPKFDKWRSGQEEFIDVIITSDKRAKVGCAPTGFGKSPAVVGAAVRSGLPTCIVTATNGLLDQYMADFQSMGMVSLKGKRQYKCDFKPEDPSYSCEEGHAGRCPYKGSIGCPLSQAEMAAATSSLVVSNYAKWTSSKMFGQGMQHFQQVIFDEGHETAEALADALQVVLNRKEIEDGLQLDFPAHKEQDNMLEWKRWASNARAAAEAAMMAAQARITGISDPKPTHVKHFTHMRNLCKRLAVINTCRALDWVVDEIDGGFQFDPIRPGRYAESNLLFNIPSIIVVSATVHPKTMYMIGMGKDTFEFREFDSDFDPKRCPLYYLPIMRVDARAGSLDQIWLTLDQFANKRKDRNGIVHTISYTRREEILATSRHASRMIFNERGQPIASTIDKYRSIYPGAIMVTPSVEAGYDFRKKECEWQFICKIPFDPPSKILKAREADDPDYRAYRAIQRLNQIPGRGMRSKDDQCETLIGDMHLDWFLPKYRHLTSKSFRRFFKQVSVLPQPPERLP